jgi:Amt family ammonium transporter
VIDPWSAILIAVIASGAFVVADWAMLKLKLDDVVAAVPMHLCGGIVGTLFVGFFARKEYVVEFYGARPEREWLREGVGAWVGGRWVGVGRPLHRVAGRRG